MQKIDSMIVGIFVCVALREDSMIVSRPRTRSEIFGGQEYRKMSLEHVLELSHFSRTNSKGHKTTTWISNRPTYAQDFDSHTNDLVEAT